MSKPPMLNRRRVIGTSLAGMAAKPLSSLAQALPATEARLWTPEVLGERLWINFQAADLPTGSIASWKDRSGSVTATQSDPAKQPTKTAANEVFFGGPGRQLQIPFQPNAHLAHRAVVMLFRIDTAAFGSGDGGLFFSNGIDGGIYARQPAIGYEKVNGKTAIWVCWRTPSSYNKLTFPIDNDPQRWHCLVSRRVNGRHFASLDGGPEIQVGQGMCLGKNNVNATGLIGDFRANAPTWALDCVLLLQDELSLADAQRLSGWALWRRGAQGNLPNGHPYRTAAPTIDPSALPAPFVESTPAQWKALQDQWSGNGAGRLKDLTSPRTPLDLNGYQLVFEDHFTSMTVTDEVTGTGPWWTPVHQAATGSARTARLSTDPDIITQSGSELTIRMQKTAKGWTSGVITSVNANGHGNRWKYGYFEFRARASRGNGFAAWPALWVKSANEFFRLTESRLEIDIYEGYNSDPIGHHQSYHNWPAKRLMRGRLDQHRYIGNYAKLVRDRYGRDFNLFDNDYHLYGLQIDERWTRFYFDGIEIGHLPTPPEAKQEVFILVDLAMLPQEAAKASGTYELTLDYVRVYQLKT